MTPTILLQALKYGVGSAIAIYLVWQMGSTQPVIVKDIVEVKAAQAVIVGQHKIFGEQAEKANDLNAKLLRGICLGMHKTQQAQQQFCNP